MRRRLKIEPTYRTDALALVDDAWLWETGASIPGGITWTLAAAVPNSRTISAFENSEIVTTAYAALAERRARKRRRVPSRQVNHSGCAANDTSCKATTRDTPVMSGVE